MGALPPARSQPHIAGRRAAPPLCLRAVTRRPRSRSRSHRRRAGSRGGGLCFSTRGMLTNAERDGAAGGGRQPSAGTHRPGPLGLSGAAQSPRPPRAALPAEPSAPQRTVATGVTSQTLSASSRRDATLGSGHCGGHTRDDGEPGPERYRERGSRLTAARTPGPAGRYPPPCPAVGPRRCQTRRRRPRSSHPAAARNYAAPPAPRPGLPSAAVPRSDAAIQPPLGAGLPRPAAPRPRLRRPATSVPASSAPAPPPRRGHAARASGHHRGGGVGSASCRLSAGTGRPGGAGRGRGSPPDGV